MCFYVCFVHLQSKEVYTIRPVRKKYWNSVFRKFSAENITQLSNLQFNYEIFFLPPHTNQIFKGNFFCSPILIELNNVW